MGIEGSVISILVRRDRRVKIIGKIVHYPSFWIVGSTKNIHKFCRVSLALFRAVPRRNTRGLCSQGTSTGILAEEVYSFLNGNIFYSNSRRTKGLQKEIKGDG
jgi:hypothetical protein